MKRQSWQSQRQNHDLRGIAEREKRNCRQGECDDCADRKEDSTDVANASRAEEPQGSDHQPGEDCCDHQGKRANHVATKGSAETN